jgi:four helix bundle protein
MSDDKKVNSYRDLRVWQRSLTLATRIYRLTEAFPKQQTFGLCSQMQRTAVSIPSNIAEGNQRDSTKEYLHFVSIALGSAAELETQTLLAEQLHYLRPDEAQPVLAELDEIGRTLRGIQKHLKEKLS